MNFQLGGVIRDMDMPQLSQVLGLFCDERKFKWSQKDHGKARTAFWKRMTGEETWLAHSNTDMSIRYPNPTLFA